VAVAIRQERFTRKIILIMGKIQDDNEKAHKERMKVFAVLKRITTGTSFDVEMQNDEKGHSFLLWYNKDYSYRTLDIRFDNGQGIYWKDRKSPASFESLTLANPVFIVALEAKDQIRSLAVFDLKNHYLKESRYWEVGGVGNRNRLQNRMIPRNLREQTGYEIIHGSFCPELIEYFKTLFE